MEHRDLPPGQPDEPLLNEVPDDILAAHSQGRAKICFDQMFIKATVRAIQGIRTSLAYEYLKLVLVAVFSGIIYSANFHEDGNFDVWMCVLGGTFFTIAAQQYYHSSLQNTDTLVRASLVTGHLLAFPNQAEINQVYNAGAPEEPEPADTVKTAMEFTLSKAILSYLQMTSRFARNISNIGELVLIACIIALIVSLSTTDLPESTKWVTITYVVLECMVRIKYILILLFIAFIPLLCIIFCCVACCTKTPNAGAFIENQVVQQYKVATDAALQTDCIICYSNFAEGEDIIKLPCSDKHIFHEFCIKQWLKIRSTCPTCRHDFKAQ